MGNKIYDIFINKLCQNSNVIIGIGVFGWIALIFLKLLAKTPHLKNIGHHLILNR